MTASGSARMRENLRLALRTPGAGGKSITTVYVGTGFCGQLGISVHVSRGTPELVAGYSVSAYW